MAGMARDTGVDRRGKAEYPENILDRRRVAGCLAGALYRHGDGAENPHEIHLRFL